MNTFNDPGCVTTGGNTGVPSCDFIPKNIIGCILAPATLELTAAEVATSAAFITKMQALMVATEANRIYPIWNLVPESDKSEEDVFTTGPTGKSNFVRHGKPGWVFDNIAAGLFQHREIRKHNLTKTKKVFLVDSDYTVFGTASTTRIGGMKGFAMSKFFAKSWKPNTGAAETKFQIELILDDAKELNDTIQALTLAVNPQEVIKGLIDIELVLITQDATSCTVQAVEKISRIPLDQYYATELADLDAWVVVKESAGSAAPVTPTLCAHVEETSAFKVTMTTPSGVHKISMASPSALVALNIGGAPDYAYESDTLTVTFS